MCTTSDSAAPSRSALERLLVPDRWIYRSRHPRIWVGLCFTAGTWNLFLGILGTLTLRNRKWLGLLPLAAGVLQILGGFRMYQIRVSSHDRLHGEQRSLTRGLARGQAALDGVAQSRLAFSQRQCRSQRLTPCPANHTARQLTTRNSRPYFWISSPRSRRQPRQSDRH